MKSGRLTGGICIPIPNRATCIPRSLKRAPKCAVLTYTSALSQVTQQMRKMNKSAFVLRCITTVGVNVSAALGGRSGQMIVLLPSNKIATTGVTQTGQPLASRLRASSLPLHHTCTLAAGLFEQNPSPAMAFHPHYQEQWSLRTSSCRNLRLLARGK